MVPLNMSLSMSKRQGSYEEAAMVSPAPKRCKYDSFVQDDSPDKVGATELASAFALASLASFSPGSNRHETAPESRDVEHGDEATHYSLEARSNDGQDQDDVYPVTPDPRSTMRGLKRVHFAPNPNAPERKGARIDSLPPRTMREQGSRLPPGFRRAPVFVGPHHRPHQMPMSPMSPMSNMSPMSPRSPMSPMSPMSPWSMRPPQRMMVPPGGFMPPPVMHQTSNQWICDFCNIASFATYEEACVHEESCGLRCRMQHAPPSPHTPVPRRKYGPPMWQIQGMPPIQPTLSMPPAVEHRHQPPPPPPPPPLPSLPSASSRDWFQGSRFLSVPHTDTEWLSELNCFLRSTCVEAFSAEEDQVSRTSKRGRITLHQVGIRCGFCAHKKMNEKAVAAVSFPTSVAGIYESVKRWQRVHVEACEDIPEETKAKLGGLATSNVWTPTTRQYWADSAKALGMVDTEDGIRFGSDPASHSMSPTAKPAAEMVVTDISKANTLPEGKAIVYQEDLKLVPPYVFFLVNQVESCRFTEADRFVARSKGPVGYPGFQCRHCNGHAGLGKYFPVSSKSLSTNSTSQNIHAHLLKCRKCPADIKRQLVCLKEEKGKAPRLEPGWRKIFFDKVWERMHGTRHAGEMGTTTHAAHAGDMGAMTHAGEMGTMAHAGEMGTMTMV
jgi:hypothetical protein